MADSDHDHDDSITQENNNDKNTNKNTNNNSTKNPTFGQDNPYYLHHAENTDAALVSLPLSENSYESWIRRWKEPFWARTRSNSSMEISSHLHKIMLSLMHGEDAIIYTFLDPYNVFSRYRLEHNLYWQCDTTLDGFLEPVFQKRSLPFVRSFATNSLHEARRKINNCLLQWIKDSLERFGNPKDSSTLHMWSSYHHQETTWHGICYLFLERSEWWFQSSQVVDALGWTST